MNADIIQKQYDLLIEKVAQMRQYQDNYFRHRASQDLQKAKALEREVDAIIRREYKAKTSLQKPLF